MHLPFLVTFLGLLTINTIKIIQLVDLLNLCLGLLMMFLAARHKHLAPLPKILGSYPKVLSLLTERFEHVY